MIEALQSHVNTANTTSLQSAPPRTITLELETRDSNRLRSEHERLPRNATQALAWDRFLQTCVIIGVERLQRIPAADALNLVGLLEGKQMRLFRQITTALPVEAEKRAETLELIDGHED
jgi:hypothetical protein